eukprot:14662052-Alexandrium_andersonii.AAC.1
MSDQRQQPCTGHSYALETYDGDGWDDVSATDEADQFAYETEDADEYDSCDDVDAFTQGESDWAHQEMLDEE